MSINKFNYSRQNLTDLAPKSDSISKMCSVTSMFVPQNKCFASKFKGGKCRCTQEGGGGEAEALVCTHRSVAGRQRFFNRGNVGVPISPQDNHNFCAS